MGLNFNTWSLSEEIMGKTLKLLTFILISFVLVMGVSGEAIAKKKKKSAVATESEKALFDKWKVKKKIGRAHV